MQHTTNYNLNKPEDSDYVLIEKINANMDAIDAQLKLLSDGKKPKQTAKTSPSKGSSPAVEFIATVSQDADGVITATKQEVKGMTGATSSANGAAGLVPQPTAANYQKYLRGDGTWNTPTNTTYSAGTGLALNSTTFSLATSGASAGSYGPSAAVTGNNNATMSVPYITVDTYGRVTSISNKTYTAKNTTYSNVSKTAAGLCPALPNESATTKYLRQDGTWVTPPDTNTTYSAASGGGLTLSSNAFSLSNSGATAGSYGPSAAVTGNDGTTMNVPYITVDAKGRVTSISNKVYTSKNTTYSAATTSAAGLMSAADKTKLNGISNSANYIAPFTVKITGSTYTLNAGGTTSEDISATPAALGITGNAVTVGAVGYTTNDPRVVFCAIYYDSSAGKMHYTIRNVSSDNNRSNKVDIYVYGYQYA